MLPLKIPQFQEVIKSTWHGYLCGVNVKKEIENYIANPNPEIFDKLNGAMQDMNSYYTTYAESIHKIESLTNKVLTIGFIIIVLLFCVIVFLTSLSISRAITEPISELVTSMDKVVVGDLSGEIKINSRDELGQLASSFNRMKQDMLQTISHANQIANGDYSNVILPKSDKDELSISLNQMTKALHESREYRNTIFNSIQVGAMLINPDSDEIEYVNPLASDMIGTDEETIVGNIYHKYISQTQMEDTGQEKTVKRFESILTKANGRKIDILISVRKINVNNQEIIMLTFLDISDRKDAERKKSEALYKLQVANEELEDYTEKLQSSQIKLEEQQEELQVSNEELEEKTEFLKRQKLEIENKNVELEKARSDIEHKAEQLELSNKYKSEFLANMSHELRTPLNSLLILSRDLADNSKNNLDEKQVEASEIIYKSGTDLLNLINEILDLSKIEAGMITIEFQSVLLNNIAQNIKRNFQHQADKKRLKLEVIVEPDLPEEIQTDQQRIEQIIKNLLSNAIKFTTAGGITVRIHRPDPAIKFIQKRLDHKHAVAISITDTGIGIPLEKQSIIFESFQQADGSTSRKYGGTGLGLSISLELAKLLGGELQLESKEGEGSTFSIIVPEKLDDNIVEKTIEDLTREKNGGKENDAVLPSLNLKKQVVAPSIEDDRKNLSRTDRKVLVIEDDLNFARTLYKFCQEKDFKFIHAGSGEVGIEMAKNYKPDGIILDIKLPGMDGWEVLNELKSDYKLRHIPVHVMSVDEEVPNYFARGAIGYFNKPITKEQLEDAFNKLNSFNLKESNEILIVEDDENMQKIITDLISSEELKVTAVGTGNSALEQLNRKEFDCMILDLNLPDISGFDLLENLSESKTGTIPPIIIYTGRDITQQEEFKLKKFASSIIIKGIKSEKRLLDETALFLHQVVEKMPEEKQKIISLLHNKEGLFKDKNILLVDDDVRNIFAVSKILEEREANVFSAVNGEKALKLLNKKPGMHIVLMDIMMPVMDGYETMQRIRAQKRFEKLPIIALTAKAMKEDRKKCIDAGANDYISKPLEISELLSLMRVWLYN
ncbi:hypothetical protein B6I21_01085 [candidate division KSB1 bacterium 4572_119]|nr:MAG: hypothetical protein B6I21_01085 [candidate division KSB1 bacterium 4572_119]